MLKRNQRNYSSNRELNKKSNHVVKSPRFDYNTKKIIKDLIEQRWNEILAQKKEEQKATTERKHKERKLTTTQGLMKDKVVETKRLVYDRPDGMAIQVRERREAASVLVKRLANLEEEKQKKRQRTLIETKQIKTALSLFNNKSIYSLIHL